jgi:hypothetical protein
MFKSFLETIELTCLKFFVKVAFKSGNTHVTQNESSCMLKLFKAFLCIVSTNDFADGFDDEQNSIKNRFPSFAQEDFKF